MKYKIFLPLLIFIFVSCSDKDIDDEKPVIDLSITDAFPVNCDTIYFGEDFTFTALFTDNVELGSYSIEIHQNFDHHSHSTEVTECALSPIKDPVNPYHLIQDFDIPAGSKEFKVQTSISVPAINGSENLDEGDYHFFVRLTDKEGWAAQKGLSVKMLYRQATN